jgi:general secretion pathway protein I
MRSQRARQLGFTLLEVFIATAILAIAVLYMFDALTHSPDRANRAKLVTVATNLARTKMIDIEADLLKDGWEQFDDEECGDFKDDEYGNLARFQWCARIDKIELPDNVDVEGAVSKMLGLGDPDDADSAAGGQAGSTSSLLGMWMGGAGGLPGITPPSGKGSTQPNAAQSGLGSILSSFLSPFRNVVEQAIRRITLKVFWKYRGKEQDVTVIYYVTRPELVDQAIIGGFMQGMGQGTGTGTGTSGSKSSSSSSTRKTR